MKFLNIFKLNTRGKQTFIFADCNDELFKYLEKNIMMST